MRPAGPGAHRQAHQPEGPQRNPFTPTEEPRTCRPPAACGRPFGLPGRGWFQRLQALEDAIAYRRARVTAQCAACGPPSGRKCEDHARDLELIAEYQQTARAAMQDTPGPPGRAVCPARWADHQRATIDRARGLVTGKVFQPQACAVARCGTGERVMTYPAPAPRLGLAAVSARTTFHLSHAA
jgi:hypothetical protein